MTVIPGWEKRFLLLSSLSHPVGLIFNPYPLRRTKAYPLHTQIQWPNFTLIRAMHPPLESSHVLTHDHSTKVGPSFVVPWRPQPIGEEVRMVMWTRLPGYQKNSDPIFSGMVLFWAWMNIGFEFWSTFMDPSKIIYLNGFWPNYLYKCTKL